MLAVQGLGNGGLAGRGAVPYPNCRRAMSSLPRGRQARTHGLLLLVSLQPLARISKRGALDSTPPESNLRETRAHIQ